MFLNFSFIALFIIAFMVCSTSIRTITDPILLPRFEIAVCNQFILSLLHSLLQFGQRLQPSNNNFDHCMYFHRLKCLVYRYFLHCRNAYFSGHTTISGPMISPSFSFTKLLISRGEQ